MQDWRDIYSRELVASPPGDDFVAAYMGYEPPRTGFAVAAAEDDASEAWENPYDFSE